MSRSSSTFDVVCPQCNRTIVVNASQIGARCTCTDCLEEFVVVRPAQSASVTQEPVEENGSQTSPEQNPPGFDNELWEDDRKQLDALLNVEAGSSPEQVGESEPYDFTVACPLCDTRQDMSSERIGHSVRCPDCHSSYQVREPHRNRRRPRHISTEREDDELHLSDLPAVPPKKLQLDDYLEKPVMPKPGRPSAPAHVLTPEDAARDTLVRAEEELKARELDEPPLPPSPMMTGLFHFLQQPILLLRIFFISLGLWFELGAIQTALSLSGGGAMQQFGSVILRPVAAVFGALFAANVATTLIAILQDTAHGQDEITSLPGVNPVEWFFESWQVFVSLFLTWALAGIVTQVVYASTGSWNTAFWFGFVPAGFLLGTVFPIILLSFLENSTPFSSAVWQGLRSAAKQWLIFTVQALLVVSIGLVCCVARIRSSSGFWNFLLCVGMIVSSMLFFRLIGRLAWVCQEKMGDQEKSEVG